MAVKISDEAILKKLKDEKKAAIEFQKRRHGKWDEIYRLYRDNIRVNRLTQRQAVNMPIMKETVKTALSQMSESPDISFQDLDNDKDKEIVFNEMWKEDYRDFDFEGIDRLDKKNVCLYGRGFKMLNFLDNRFYCEPADIYDTVVDPLTKPYDLETAGYAIRLNIFRNLKDILASKKYSKEGKDRLRALAAGDKKGIIRDRSDETMQRRIERFKILGVDNYEDLIGHGMMLELNEHFTYLWDSSLMKFVRYCVVTAADQSVLYKKPLKDAIGTDLYPMVSWADDVDTADYWSDGLGDLVRIINKMLNVWLSQLFENRTLKNYGMNYFDSTNDRFDPSQYVPKAGGWYPVPGDPGKVIKRVEAADLSGTLNDMLFLVQMVERASATTASEKGVSETKKSTLGELEILTAKVRDRINDIAKGYRRSWYEFAKKWFAIVDANISNAKVRKLYKESISGNFYEKDILSKNWKSGSGVRIKVSNSDEKEASDSKELKKEIALLNGLGDNPVVREAAMKGILEKTNMPREKITEAIEYEKKKMAGRMPLENMSGLPSEPPTIINGK